ncbi:MULTISPECIES: MATE family efflux transporter [Suilimivivens]|jgi:MATE efflux family protein|uniref:MATE family efflux transporter n=1 Tax=Suilimivivens aceti TaxID=2981774 RepID=A0ABT2T559_9FIRM|nr:MATE family efflux transporter [Suilimivivens aceti]MCU6744986.1 MATE family efflux transporter [Suilimivivens aceti]SCI01268.1 Multidrug-efflux transporter [uncultured Clostridium sp.]
MKERLDRKQFLLYALKLAFPIMIQNLISTLVNSADTIMLGYVSQTAMAASSLANQYTFVLFCFYYGLGIGTSVLCAQYFGKGDKQTVERIIGLAARVAILISLLFFVFSFFAPEAIMKIFTDSPQTIKEGAAYLKVLSFSFVFMGFSQVFVSALRSVGKIVFPSALYVVSLLVNVLMNAAFIFGLFGLPRLGVVGVALGTVSARAVEVILCFVYSAAGKDIKFRLKNLFRRSGVLFKDFLKISAPSVVNDLMWGMAATTCTAILGHIGDDMVAANAVAVMVVNMGAIVCRGFSNATTIIVSQTLGENRMEDTKVYAKRILWLTVIVSLLGCCVILAIRPFMVQFYRDKLTETAIYYLGIIMIMTTWRLVGEGINTCLICGCFRGGGDAKFGMVVDTVFMWGVSVPLMAIAAYVLKLPPVWVYFVMTLDEFEKMPVVFAHYFKFKWMKNITRDQKELEG